MVAAGVEIMVGVRVDPQFGPLIVVALGGVLVELLRDTLVALAPMSASEARAMLQRLQGVRLLRGFRGSAPVEMERLTDTAVRLYEFAADQADCITD